MSPIFLFLLTISVVWGQDPTPVEIPVPSEPTPVEVPEVPEPVEVPEVPEVPEPVEVPDVPEVPEPVEVPDVPEVPEPVEVPEVPEPVEVPDVPEVPEPVEVPDVPEVPEPVEVPDVPEVPEPVEVPDVPEVPEVPPPVNTPPSIVCPNDYINVVRGVSIAYTVTATDAEDGALTPTCVPSDSPFVPPAGQPTLFVCFATDSGGLSATCSFTVTIANNPPSIHCPTNIQISRGGVVNYPLATASDPDAALGDGISSLSCSPPSGNNFPLRTTTVTCSAVDFVGASASCDFNVVPTCATSNCGVCAGTTCSDCGEGFKFQGTSCVGISGCNTLTILARDGSTSIPTFDARIYDSLATCVKNNPGNGNNKPFVVWGTCISAISQSSGGSGSVTFSVAPGTYTVVAKSPQGVYKSQSVTVTAPAVGCQSQNVIIQLH